MKAPLLLHQNHQPATSVGFQLWWRVVPNKFVYSTQSPSVSMIKGSVTQLQQPDLTSLINLEALRGGGGQGDPPQFFWL